MAHLTDEPSEVGGSRPGEGDEPLRSAALDRVGRQKASGARIAASARSRALWVAVGVWLALILLLAIWRDASVASTIGLLIAGAGVAMWMTSRASMKAVQAIYPKDRRVTIETSSAGIWLRTVDGTWHAPWTDFRSAERSRRHLLLHRRDRGGAVVLVPDLLGPEVYDDLAAGGIPVNGSDED